MSSLGVVLSLAGIDDIVSAAQLAERAGFESVWTTEFPGQSATVPLAAVAIATERVTVGTAIAYAFGRTPLVLAAEARDLDELSGGRLILGLGTGTQRMQRDWHGLDGKHPAARMEELVPLLRSLLLLDQAPLEHEGRFYRTVVAPTAPVPPARRADLPIYMAGVNARMIEAAGAVSDGLVGHPLFTPEYTRDVVRPALARGAERAGRSEPPPIAGYLTCFVGEDGTAARQAARGIIAFNATVSTYRPVLAYHGFEAHADEIRSAWERRDFAGMAAAVSDEMLDTIAIAGTPDEVRSQYEQRRAGLFERTLLWSPLGGLESTRATINAFALEAVRASPARSGTVELIACRPAEGEREVLEHAQLDPAVGLVGDRWHGSASKHGADTQLTLMNARAAALVAGPQSRWPEAGDQLYVDLDLSAANLPPGSRLSLGSAVIEVTPIPHTGCGKFLRRFGIEAQKLVNSPAGRELNLRGINARVLTAGTVRTGDVIEKL